MIDVTFYAGALCGTIIGFASGLLFREMYILVFAKEKKE
jgi:gas vesicle protein